jgi:predicted RNase H-like nuclease (RuvC/YqgF family)
MNANIERIKALAEMLRNEKWEYFAEQGSEGHGTLLTAEEIDGHLVLGEPVFKRLYDSRADFELKKMFLAEANPRVLIEMVDYIKRLENWVEGLEYEVEDLHNELADVYEELDELEQECGPEDDEEEDE